MHRAVQYILASPLSVVGYLLAFVGRYWLGDLLDAAMMALVIVVGLYAGMVGTLWLLWLMYCDISPSRRLASLHDNIQDLLNSLHRLNPDSAVYDPEVKAKAIVLKSKLQRLGIQTPDLREGAAWYEMLPDLMAYAADGRIKDAQAINDF